MIRLSPLFALFALLLQAVAAQADTTIAQAREALLPELAFGLDGQATRRILDLIRETAIPGDMVG